jgi:hypothetical protein
MLLFPFSWDGFIYIWHLIICNTTCPMNHWGGERGEGRKSRDMPHYVFFIYQVWFFLFLMLLFPFHVKDGLFLSGISLFVTLHRVSRESFGGRGEGGKSRDMPYYQKKCKNLMLFISHASLFTLWRCKKFVYFYF